MEINDVRTIVDNLDDFIEVPDGIERLRKAVLTLAISGRLVPQDLKEGTADELYAEIQKESAKQEALRNSRKRKAKELLSISEDETPFEIPSSWRWVRLGNVAYVEMGQAPEGKEVTDFEAGLPFFQGRSEFGEDHPTPRRWCETPRKIAEPGDILISVRAPVGTTNIALQRCGVGRGLAAIRPFTGLNTPLCRHYLEFFVDQLLEKATGTTFQAIGSEDLALLKVPLPPSDEQERIVKRVEAIMKQVDVLESKKKERNAVRTRLTQNAMRELGEGKSELALEHLTELIKTPSDLKELEKATLTLAVSGRLIPQDPKEGTAEELYAQIQIEQVNKLGGRIKKEKEFAPIAPEEIPFDIPKSWKWARLNEIGQIVGGGTPSTSKSHYFTRPTDTGSVPWLSPADMRKQESIYVSRGRQSLTTEGYKNSSATLMPVGSVLFSSRAPIGYVGIAINPLSTNQGFKSVVPAEGICSEYVYWYLRLRSEDINARAPGTTFKEISGTSFGKEIIPLPPFTEQKRIVEKVEQLEAIIADLKVSLVS